MALFWRKSSSETVVADPPPAGLEALLEGIGHLSRAWQADRDPQTARRLLRLRHLAGLKRLDAAEGVHDYPEPATGLPAGDPLPEFAPEDLTPELLRAGMLRDGCLLVRGLVPRDEALEIAAGIDRAFAEREEGRPGDHYEEFEPEPPFVIAVREWIRRGGGVLAIDSPQVATRMLETFDRIGLPQLVEGYLGEPGLLSLHKTTLRKADPSVSGAWHQDGAFMGDARALNLWLSLSRCGDEAPGLDLVPRRLDKIVIEYEEMLFVDLTRERAAEAAAAGGVEIVRPVFEPGDALFFDEMFLHQTGSDPSMPNPRFAIESWFFGAHGFPADYAPLAV
jgi:hypothetical protein